MIVPHPEPLLCTLFSEPHDAAITMLLTGTCLIGGVVPRFVYDCSICRDLIYEFYCTGTIVQIRVFTAWLKKQNVTLDTSQE